MLLISSEHEQEEQTVLFALLPY